MSEKVTFRIDLHPNRLKVLLSYAEMFGPFSVQTDEELATFVFPTTDARDRFVKMVHFSEHARPVTPENSN